ncbi:MAG: hypothetical protein Q7S79_00095 [bacterium]|nr:hypothetical protein [bacterium]
MANVQGKEPEPRRIRELPSNEFLILETLTHAYENFGWFKRHDIPELQTLAPTFDKICTDLKKSITSSPEFDSSLKETLATIRDAVELETPDAKYLEVWETICGVVSICAEQATKGSVTKLPALRVQVRPAMHIAYAFTQENLGQRTNPFMHIVKLEALGVAKVEVEDILGEEKIVTYHPVQLPGGIPMLARRIHGASEISRVTTWEEVFENPEFRGLKDSSEREADTA